MAYPTITHTFVNATTGDASKHNANMSAIVGALNSGAKDINVRNVTAVAGAFTDNLIVSGNITCYGKIVATYGTFTNLYVNNYFKAESSATVSSKLSASSDIFAGGDISCSGSVGCSGATVAGNIAVAGNNNISRNLTVSGTANIQGNLTANAVLYLASGVAANYLYGAGGGFWDGLYDGIVVIGVDGGELSINGDDWMLHWDSTEVNINGHLEVDDYSYYDDTQTVDITGEGTTYSLTPTKACIRIIGTRDGSGCTLTLQTSSTTPYNTPTFIFNDCGDIVNIAGRAATPQLYNGAVVVAIRNASGWDISKY